MANMFSAIILDDKPDTEKAAGKNGKYVLPLNKALRIFFKDAVTVSVKNPSQALFFFQTVRNQQRASRIRAKYAKEGLQVPPIMIMSITNRCNLHCKGCYHQALRDVTKAEMSEEKLRSVIREAHDLGTSFMVLAGGEPLVRRDILDITRDFPDIIFLMFTNGLLITDDIAARFKAQKNIVPMISIEGDEQETDDRRGAGVSERLQGVIERVKKQEVFFGTSITVTRNNLETVMSDEYIRSLTAAGCKFIIFVEYTPISPDTEDWTITAEQRAEMSKTVKGFRTKYSALFVSVPGYEQEFGGCLSAGRGFIHISAEGDVEPCPFAPYSDSNVREQSLQEALQSRLLRAIRESEELGKESGGACALFGKAEWIRGKREE